MAPPRSAHCPLPAGLQDLDPGVEIGWANTFKGTRHFSPHKKVPDTSLTVGEKTGELEKMLSKIADFYEAEVDAAVSGLTSLIEPMVIGFLGIVIGGIVVALFLPVFQISTLVAK